MKKSIILLIGILCSATLFSQTYKIKGKIVDTKEKEALPYVSISIYSDSIQRSPISRLAADDKGRFMVSLSPGRYILDFHIIGMERTHFNVDVSNSDVDMGLIELNESSTQLRGITVTAQRPLVKADIDKITYNAKDDPEARTSNVLDLLRKVPLVSVDGDDKIRVKGSSNFIIHINGRRSNIASKNPSQVLKGMPAASIKDIEVITEPGAKYDAEGVGGIINIVTEKQTDDGYSGSVGTQINSKDEYGVNSYLTLKYGKLGFTGNISYNTQKNPWTNLNSRRKDFAPNVENMLTQEGQSKDYAKTIYSNAGISYELDTLNLFNVNFSMLGGNFGTESKQEVLSRGKQNYSYLLATKSTGDYGNMSLSADYQHSFKKKGEILTLSYRMEHQPNNSEYENDYSTAQGINMLNFRNKNKAGGNEHTGQIDYVNPISQNQNLETGVKYILRKNESRTENKYYDPISKKWIDDAAKKNDLDHNQNILAAYVGYTYRSGNKGVKMGLRAEHTDQKAHFMSQKDTTIQSKFFDIAPSITFSYQPAMTRTLKLSYDMRVSRPGIWYLNPYVHDENPTNIYYGNPALTAEQTHRVSFNYGYFSRKVNLNASLDYEFTKNGITSYSFVQDGVTNTTYDNIGKRNSFGLNTYIGWMPSSLVSFNFNGSVSYINIENQNDTSYRNSGFRTNMYAGITFRLPKDWRLNADGGTFMPPVQLQTTNSIFYFYNFNIMKQMFKKKLAIRLNIQNPFNEFIKLKSTTKGEGFYQTSTHYRSARSIGISVSYQFGELKKSIKKIERSIKNDDIKASEENR